MLIEYILCLINLNYYNILCQNNSNPDAKCSNFNSLSDLLSPSIQLSEGPQIWFLLSSPIEAQPTMGPTGPLMETALQSLDPLSDVRSKSYRYGSATWAPKETASCGGPT